MYYSSASHKKHRRQQIKEAHQRDHLNRILKMNKLKSDIESSIWIYLYCKLRPNTGSIIAMTLCGAVMMFIMHMTDVVDTHEVACFVGGSFCPLIAFAFFFGFIHLMTGRDIRMIATKNMVEPSEVQKIAQNIFG